MRLLDFLTWLFENTWFNVFVSFVFMFLTAYSFASGDIVFGTIKLFILLYYIKTAFLKNKED